MAVKLNYTSEYSLIAGDSLKIQFNLVDRQGYPISLPDTLKCSEELPIKVRAIVKSPDQLNGKDSDNYFSTYMELKGDTTSVEINLPPEKTKHFPVGRKPNVLAIQVSVPSISFSQEFYISLTMLPSVFTSLY